MWRETDNLLCAYWLQIIAYIGLGRTPHGLNSSNPQILSALSGYLSVSYGERLGNLEI